MATPHVAGAAALLFASFPSESAYQIKARILDNARRIGVYERYWLYGILDAWRAFGGPDITTSYLPQGAVSDKYSIKLEAIGTPTITWTITSGILPNGLSLNSSGLISGTPTAAGTFSFTAKATNQAGSTTKSFIIIINPKPIAPTITQSFFPDGKVGVYYYQTIGYKGGTIPLSWGISGGSLPLGLNLDPTYGYISGTPSKAGSYKFTVLAVNSAGSDKKEFSITIASNVTPSINTYYPSGGLPEGAVSIAYR
jgi:hypothetical protein